MKSIYMVYVVMMCFLLYGCNTVETHTLSFESNGGNVLQPIDVRHGMNANLPIPTREGYVFLGWFADQGTFLVQITSQTPIQLDWILYAKWEIQSFLIYYHTLGGLPLDAVRLDYLTIVAAHPIPSRPGYTFQGWYVDAQLSEVVTLTHMPARDVYLYAKWMPNEYGIEYILFGGTNHVENPVIYTVENIPLIQDPSKEGFIFGGWYVDSDFLQPFSSISASNPHPVILYAKWIEASYRMIFDSDGGTSIPDIPTFFGQEFMFFPPPTKNGFIFQGWMLNQQEISYPFTFSNRQDIVIKAAWIEQPKFAMYLQVLDVSKDTIRIALLIGNQTHLHGFDVSIDYDGEMHFLIGVETSLDIIYHDTQGKLRITWVDIDQLLPREIPIVILTFSRINAPQYVFDITIHETIWIDSNHLIHLVDASAYSVKIAMR